jgi:hypothetical protein
MSKQPEALRLADQLCLVADVSDMGRLPNPKCKIRQAAVELRRLHAVNTELLEALQAAIDCGMVPTSSAKEGKAMSHVRQLHVADMIRDAIAKATGQNEV